MPPKGLAILLGAGPATGAGIARVLSSPSQGDMAVALLARRPESLSSLKSALTSTDSSSVIETFTADVDAPETLESAFDAIATHPSFSGLKLRAAIYNIKYPQKKPFLDESHSAFTSHLDGYVGGAMLFAQLSLRRLYADHGETPLADGGGKKGTLIFTGTLGALRANVGFAAYGAGRAGVRMLAQAVAREHSGAGVHVAHIIANGKIEDADNDDTRSGKSIAAEAVGRNYLWLIEQEPTCWVHELDLRPAREKF